MTVPLSRRDFLRRSGSLVGGAAFGAAIPAAALSAPSTSPSSDRSLAALLAENRSRYPFSSRSAHLPMSLLALSSMGASPARLEDFAEKGLRGLGPFPAGGRPVDPAAWERSLGRRESVPSFVRLFASEIRARGSETVLRRSLPVLLPGVSSLAFHALIRTAYAVRFHEEEDLPHALGCWAATFGTLGPIEEASKPDPDPLALLERARRSAQLGGKRQRGDIVAVLNGAAALPGFETVSTALSIRDDSVARMADAALRLYAATRDFTVLHLVTGTQAWRVLEPLLPDRDLGRRYYWQAFAAAYVGLGTPEVGPPLAASAASWDAILEETRGRDDDHDVKLVDACREEEKVYGEALYRRAAALRLGLA
ncbi:MAG: questin oxidase family protein [Planctomycetes bacterium]|nr:questin oxidase family protein [Planctomycetota bacterium]